MPWSVLNPREWIFGETLLEEGNGSLVALFLTNSIWKNVLDNLI